MSGDVPEGWSVRKLGDLFEPMSKPIEVSEAQEYTEIGIRSHGRGIFIKEPTTGMQLGNKAVFEVVPNCLVANIVFAWEGAIARTTHEHSGLIASHRFPQWAPRPGAADLDYFVQLLRTKQGIALAANASPGGAGRNRTLNRSALMASTVLAPPLPEQKKIAAILSSVDAAIWATQAVIDQTRRVKEGLLQDLLTRGIGHTRFKQTEIGEIPESWEAKRLGDYVEADSIQNGLYRPSSDYGEDGYPIVRIDAFDHGDRLRVDGLRRVRVNEDEASRYGLQAGDILLNRVNSLSHIAKTAIVDPLAEVTLFESNMMRIRLAGDLRPNFLMAVLCLSSSRDYFRMRAKKAVAQTSVNQTDVRNLPLAVPPPAEQERIERILMAVERQGQAANQSAGQLLASKSGLLQDLLTGRVRVTP